MTEEEKDKPMAEFMVLFDPQKKYLFAAPEGVEGGIIGSTDDSALLAVHRVPLNLVDAFTAAAKAEPCFIRLERLEED